MESSFDECITTYIDLTNLCKDSEHGLYNHETTFDIVRKLETIGIKPIHFEGFVNIEHKEEE